MAKHLTARFCASVKATGQQAAYPDDDPKGLELRVSADGRKVWSYRYRTLSGQQKRLTLGVFVPGEDDEPTAASVASNAALPLTLKAARRVARQARAAVERGGDPAADRRKEKERAKAEPLRTFNDLADAYLRDCADGTWKPKRRPKRQRTVDDERGILKRHIRPVLGSMPLEEIDRKAVKSLLRAMVKKGIGAQTNRTQAVIRQCFAYAISQERVENNPATGFAPMATESARARVATDAELKAVWGGLAAPEKLSIVDPETGEKTPLHLSRPMAIILQLAMLLLQRRSEIAGMRIEELNLAEQWWLIPSERAKNHKPHFVPLPPRAIELIEEAIRLNQLAPWANEDPTNCVFPGRRNHHRPIRGDSVTHALASVCNALAIKGLSVHDLRRTGSTAMTSERLGVAPFIRSLVLAHTTDSGGGAAVSRAHYDANTYAKEKRGALTAWENLLLEIVGETQRPDNVTPFAGAAA